MSRLLEKAIGSCDYIQLMLLSAVTEYRNVEYYCLDAL